MTSVDIYEFLSKSTRVDHIYKHFDTIENCNIYIINNKQLKITKTCCGGRGCLIEMIEKKIVTPVLKGTCDICFLDGQNLYNKCNTCKQPFCGSCIQKLTSKVCPYCRGTLKD